MNYKDTVNFIKLFLLLMNGGMFILRKLIYKLISASGKSLDDLLMQNREFFEDKLKKNRKQFDLLFPINNQNADIEQWDISLLTLVLLNPFQGLLEEEDLKAIQIIRDQRNKILAHKAKSEMTLEDFLPAWNQVSSTLTNLSKHLKLEDQNESNLIQSSIYQDPFQNDIAEKLKKIGQTDSLVHNVVEYIMPLVNDKISDSEKKTQLRIENLLQRLEQIERKQIEQGNIQDQHGHEIFLLARMQANIGSASSSRQVQKEVQDHILKASNRIMSKDPDVNISEDEVESTLDDLVKGMEEQGVKVKKVEKGSILLTILCPTITCVRDIVVYMKSPQINYNLTQIEKAVDKYHACEAKITIDIDLHSLETAVNTLEEELDVGAVYLTLECSGTLGVKNAFQMFENGESTNTLNKLSEALSHKVGKKVKLHTSIDKDKLEDDIEKEKERKEEDERKFGKVKQYFERNKHDADMRRKVRQQLQEHLQIMRKSDERSLQLLKEHFDKQFLNLDTERKNVEDESNLKERNDSHRAIYKEMWKENKEDLRRLMEVQQMLLKPQAKMRMSLERSQQLLDNICESNMPGDECFTQLKENESVIRGLNKALDKTTEELDLLLKRAMHRQSRRKQITKEIERKEEEDERQYFERIKHEEERRTKVQQQLPEDLEKMRKGLERSQQLLNEHFRLVKERKEEDESNLRERQDFHRSFYEEILKENKDDLRRLIEVSRTVEEPLEKMLKSFERSQQLLNNPLWFSMFGFVFQTQLEENKSVIRRLNKELDRTRDELELLRKRALHRQRRRQHNLKGTERKEEDERALMEEKEYLEETKHDAERRKDNDDPFRRLKEGNQLVEGQANMEVLVRNLQLPEKQYGMVKERNLKDEGKSRLARHYFERNKNDSERRKENEDEITIVKGMRQQAEETLGKMMESDERSRQKLLEKQDMMGKERKEEDERMLNVERRYFEGKGIFKERRKLDEDHFRDLNEIEENVKGFERNRRQLRYGMEKERKDEDEGQLTLDIFPFEKHLEKRMRELDEYKRTTEIYEERRKIKEETEKSIEGNPQQLLFKQHGTEKQRKEEDERQLTFDILLFEKHLEKRMRKLDEYKKTTEIYEERRKIKEEIEKNIEGNPQQLLFKQHETLSKQLAGAAIGGAAGTVGGPPGAVLGGTIGSLFGGLFDDSDSDSN